MSSKYCSSCIQKLPLSRFLKDPLAGPTSRVYSTCIQCRGKTKASKRKRTALQALDPNIQRAKRVRRSDTAPQPTIPAPQLHPPQLPQLEPLPHSPTEPRPPPAPVTGRPAEPTGFLPADEWRRIQDFNRAMEAIQMETCQHCQERGFLMDLKDGTCHRCFLRDTDNQKRPVTPFLMSAENDMDPGIVPADLPQLTQVEEMVIARAHV